MTQLLAWRRVTLLAGAALIALLIGIVAAVSLGQDTPPTRPVLGSNAAAAVDSPSAPATLSDAQIKAIAGFDEIDTTGAWEAARAGGANFYIAGSREGASRFCAFATGPGPSPNLLSASFTCLRRSDLGSGAATVSLQLKPGGLEQPRAYFGVVPDGISTVVAAGRSVSISNNAYGFDAPRGDAVADVGFRQVTGEVTSVPLFRP